MLLSNNPSLYRQILTELGYHQSDEVFLKLEEAIISGIGILGETCGIDLINYTSITKGIPRIEVLKRFDILESAIKRVFGTSADFVLRQIKSSLASHSISKDENLSVDRLLDELEEIRTLGVLEELKGHKHVAFIYNSNISKAKVASVFFGKDGDSRTAKGIFTDEPSPYGSLDSDDIIYFSLTSKQSSDSDMTRLERNFDKLTNLAHELHYSKTKVVIENDVWLHSQTNHGHLHEIESKIARLNRDVVAVCMYSAKSFETLDSDATKSILDAHDGVILDAPLKMLIRGENNIEPASSDVGLYPIPK